jgi:hypothetical protein
VTATAILGDGTVHTIDHLLKTWPDKFREIREGAAVHEFRKNDRDFQRGDIALLQEFVPIPGRYTGEVELVEILAISYGPEWGIPAGFACFSIRRLEPVKITLPTQQ